MNRRDRHEDAGASLVMALLFLTVVGLVGGAVLTYVSGALADTTALRGGQSETYAGEAAIQAAIQVVRSEQGVGNAPGYGFGGASPNPCLPSGKTVTMPPGAEPADVPSITAMCAVAPTAPALWERTIRFWACPANAGSCTATSPSVIAAVKTTFHDLAVSANGRPCTTVTVGSGNQPDACFAPGTAVDISAWTVYQSDNNAGTS